MLIVALVLALIGLAALVSAVVTSNELIAWVCIGASGLGVVLLVVDSVRDHTRRRPELAAGSAHAAAEMSPPVESEEAVVPEAGHPAEDSDMFAEDHPDEVVHDEPDFDVSSDDEPEYPEPAEEAAVHTVSDESVAAAADEDFADELTAYTYVAAEADTVEDDSAFTYVRADDSVGYTYVSADEDCEVTDERPGH